MQYVKQQITSFLTSNLTQLYPDYNPTTTYVLESGTPTSASIVRYGAYYWRSLTNGNVGFNPEEYENIKWIKWQTSNAFAMLDVSALSKSIKTGDDMIVSFALTKSTDTIGIGYYEADTILIEVLNASDVVMWDYEVPSTIFDGVEDWWTWTYPSYVYETDKNIMIKIPSALGTKCRVTFTKPADEAQASCGFLVAGEAVDMGTTLSRVSFSVKSYAVKSYDDFGTLSIIKRAVQDVVDFETLIDKGTFVSKKRKIKEVYNDIIMFIVDENESSTLENLITLGVIQDAKPVIDEFNKSIITWSIVEAI